MNTYTKEPLSSETNLQFLIKLFWKIENGEIRVPEFQRGYVWSEEQIRGLFESIYEGYPIGSILLWKTNDRSIKTSFDKSIPFPQSKTRYPTIFILDGVQRLSTLYGVLYNQQNQVPLKFKVAFDLTKKEFLHIGNREPKSHELLLSSLFSPNLISLQQSFNDQENKLELFDSSRNLYNIFQQYVIPVVTIGERNVIEMFEIFTRINTKGTVLIPKQIPKAYRPLLKKKTQRKKINKRP
jgi:hypothetical protein